MANSETYKLSGRPIENVMVSSRGSGVVMDWEQPISQSLFLGFLSLSWSVAQPYRNADYDYILQ